MLKTIIKIFNISFSIFLLVTCDNYEFPKSPYPRIETLPVINISETGVTLQGNITQLGEKEITHHGFVWGLEENPSIDNADKIQLGAASSQGNFETDIKSGLYEGEKYFVRAFLTTEDHIVYGNAIEFSSLGSNAPIIINFYPSTGSLGDTVTIRGIGFSYRETSNIVKFSNTISVVTFSTDSLLRVIVPENLSSTSAPISIEIANKKTITSSPFILKIPTLLASNKATINLCDTVIFNVANIGPASTPKIYFNNKASEILSQTQNQIKVLVPVLPANNLNVQAKLSVGSFESILSALINLNSPGFTKLESEQYSFLDTITLNIKNMPLCEFDVKIDGKPVSILESSNEYLKVIVPGVLNDPWRIWLQVYLKSEKLYDTFYDRVLRIDSVTPSSGQPGDIITIKGRGFHPTLNNNVVCFTCLGTGFGDHGEIISGNTRELKVKIPSTPPNNIGISLFTQNLGISPRFPFEVK